MYGQRIRNNFWKLEEHPLYKNIEHVGTPHNAWELRGN
jgi:hypothetical protein